MDDPTPASGASSRSSRPVVIGRGLTWLSVWSARWIVIALGAVVLGYLVKELWSILLPVVLAMILTSVLEPVNRLLRSRLRFPAPLAAGASVVGALVLVGAIIALFAPSVSDQVIKIAASASDGLEEVRQWVSSSDLVTSEQVDNVVSAAQDRLQSSAATIASGLITGVSAVTSVLINVLLTLVLSFFFLKDGDRFLPWVRRLSGAPVGLHLVEVGTRAWATLGGFVRTQALVGLIDAVLIGLGLVVIGVPLAAPLAVLTFVGAFAPIIGAVTVGALAVLVALVTNGVGAAIAIFVVVLVVQQLEGNVLLPWLQGRSLRLHAAVVLLTIVLGSTLFGIAGAFLSVPFVAVVAVALRYLDEMVHQRTDGDHAPEAVRHVKQARRESPRESGHGN